jgi:diketogulonate reductase-like aldo/keto reductase
MKPDRNGQPATIKAVLILDGDVLVRMPVVQFLRDCGYQAVKAANTDEAMAILQKTNVPVEIALAWVLRQDNVCAIPRATKTAHVRGNRGALDIRLWAADLAELDRAFPPPTSKQRLAVL